MSNAIDAPTASSREMLLDDLAIRLAGYAQDGIQSLGGLLARLAGRSNHDVITFMTIPATVAGGNSVYQVRMGEGVLTVGDQVDVLVAFYADSCEQHISSLKDGGILLYDSGEFTPEVSGNYQLIGIPFSEETEKALGGKGRGKNLFVLGLLANLYRLNTAKLSGLIRDRFGKKGPEVLQSVLTPYEAGLNYDLSAHVKDRYELKESAAEAVPQVTMDGNQALAYGLLTAGVRYGASYPITPATTIMEILRGELPKYGGIFLQTEDELAAICAAIGMSYGGHLAVTSTSGPGMSLKLEALGYASMAEIPLLVVNVQRGGPSTGIPTQVEQSDLMQAIWGSHGDNPRPVLAAQSVEDCYYVALEAASIARKYSTPVVILSDQIMATRVQGFAKPDLASQLVSPVIDLAPRPADFRPYDLNKITRHAPPGTKMLSGKYPTITGLEHDEDGKPNPGPKNHLDQQAKRRNKIKLIADELPTAASQVFGEAAGKLLIVGWGSTYGPLREATIKLKKAGHSVGHLQLRHINPLPKDIADVFGKYEHVVVVEMNDEGIYGYGQLAMHLRGVTACGNVKSLCKTDGLSFNVSEVIEGVRSYLG